MVSFLISIYDVNIFSDMINILECTEFDVIRKECRFTMEIFCLGVSKFKSWETALDKGLVEKFLEAILSWISHQSWKVLESPGIWKKSWKMLESPEILLKFWKSPGTFLEFFLRSNSPEERFLNKHQHFSDFLCILNVAIHWLTAVIFIWGILDAIMSTYSQHITGWRYSNLQSRA